MINKNSNGFTLVELLMAISLCVGLAYILSEIFLTTNKFINSGISKQERYITEKTIENYLLSMEALELSAELPQNANLKSCMTGVVKSGCSSLCCSATETDFYILDPMDKKPTPDISTAIAGISQDPVFYDINGVPGCQQNCKFKTTSKYFPQCYGGLPNCDKAAFIKVSLSTEPAQESENFQKRTTETIYYIKNNSPPFIETIFSDLSLTTMSGRQSLDVKASSGSATEYQYIFYDLCQSSAPNIVKVTCYGFKNDFSKVYIDIIGPGSAEIRLRINDGESQNNLSETKAFNVTVTVP